VLLVRTVEPNGSPSSNSSPPRSTPSGRHLTMSPRWWNAAPDLTCCVPESPGYRLRSSLRLVADPRLREVADVSRSCEGAQSRSCLSERAALRQDSTTPRARHRPGIALLLPLQITQRE